MKWLLCSDTGLSEGNVDSDSLGEGLLLYDLVGKGLSAGGSLESGLYLLEELLLVFLFPDWGFDMSRTVPDPVELGGLENPYREEMQKYKNR